MSSNRLLASFNFQPRSQSYLSLVIISYSLPVKDLRGLLS